ncbi:helix-turn-helix domain-containing protein [Crenothrix polyspora]|uniref:Transcriptional regulator, XRE family n=1 Tax=Crenothrix polyspora TaxID=360316 RepID=A0A1R4H636_9GAMM|nr:helix-turn-helix domain-containing protein [Crenothrix polyspora]SJM91637.1 Transcriptional regulator, XRE family [Crenothrix polyspora]
MDIEKIAQAIETDAGMPLADIRQALTEMQSETGRITTAEQILVRSARTKCGLSQQAFAARIKTPVATLRDWEQGRFVPPGGVLCLLKIIYNHPDLLGELDAA